VDFGLLGVRVASKTKETDMKSLRFITVCAALALVTSTAGFAQNVQTDFDHQANFAQYKTYSWQKIEPSVSLWDSRTKNAVNTQMEAKGLVQVADGGDIGHCGNQDEPNAEDAANFLLRLRRRLAMARVWRLRRFNHDRAGLPGNNHDGHRSSRLAYKI